MRLNGMENIMTTMDYLRAREASKTVALIWKSADGTVKDSDHVDVPVYNDTVELAELLDNVQYPGAAGWKLSGGDTLTFVIE